jgi:putative ABC transport system permease protein
MIVLFRQTLRHRWPALLATLLVMTLGAVVTGACGVLLESAIRGEAAVVRFERADAVVVADQSYEAEGERFPELVRLPDDSEAKIAALAVVQSVSVDTTLPGLLLSAEASRSSLDVSLHNWSSLQWGGTLSGGSKPVGATDAAITGSLATTAGLMIGDSAMVIVNGEQVDLRVTGIISGRGEGLYLTDQAIADLDPRDGIQAVAVAFAPHVTPSDGIVRLKTALGHGVLVLTGPARGTAEVPGGIASDALVSLSAVFGGLAGMITVIIVGTTLALAIGQRRREIALMRAIGVTPGQVRGLVAAEALAIGFIAAGVASAAITPVARLLLVQFKDAGLVPAQLLLASGPLPLVAAGGLALASAIGASILAARRWTVVRPVDALRTAGSETARMGGRFVTGGVVAMGALALSLVTGIVMHGAIASATAAPAAMVWVGALSLLAPMLVVPLVRLLGVIPRVVGGATGRVAARGAKTTPVRMAEIAIPVMLVVGVAGSLIIMQLTLDDRPAGASILAPSTMVANVEGGAANSTIDAIAHLPEIASASALVTGTAWHERQPAKQPDEDDDPDDELDITEVALVGVDDATLLDLVVSQGTLDLSDSQIALDENTARALDLGVGDDITMRMGDSRNARFRIAAILATPDATPVSLVTADALLQHTSLGISDTLLITPAPGIAMETAARAAAEVTGGRLGLVSDITPHEGSDAGSWVSYLLSGVIVLYALISLVNTLIVWTLDRRADQRLYRLLGASRIMVLRMLLIESLLGGVAGVILGGLAAVFTLVPFAIAVTGAMQLTSSALPFALVLAVGPLLIGTLTVSIVGAGMLRSRMGHEEP